MTSSEKILAGIIDEAKLKADEIIKDAESQAEQILNEAAKESESECDLIIDKANGKAKIIESTGRSSAELLKRDKALICRREAIEKILDEVVDEIKSYDDKKYFDYLCSLIEKSALSLKGDIFLDAQGLARNTAEFKTKLAGYNLTLSDTPADINGGFILKYNDIQINGELKALIREKREILVDKINVVLFG